MIAYKVVWEKRRGVFVSSTASDELEVRYRIGRWTEAPIGGLLCWDSLERATKFRIYNRRFVTFEAKVEDPIPLPPIRAVCPDLLDCAEHIWLRHQDPYCDNANWPSGTMAFRRVRLLKRLAAVTPAGSLVLFA